MGLFDAVSSIGSTIWNGAKAVGDTIGLDGSFGYDGTWNNSLAGSSIPGNSVFQANHPSVGNEGLSQWTVPTSVGGAVTKADIGNDSSWFKDWFKNTTSNDWRNYASIAGVIGKGYLGYKTYKDAHALNKSKLADSELNRKVANIQLNTHNHNSALINNAYSNSGLAEYYDKKRKDQYAS